MHQLTPWKRRALIIAGLCTLLAITTISTMEWALERGRVAVPNLLGAAAPLAIERLKEYDLEGKIVGESYHPSIPKGAVIHQDPAPGARVKAKRTVRLTISQGSDELFLPDFTFQPKDRVRRYMGSKGLALGDLCQVHSGKVPRDTIIAQSPPPGTRLHLGDPVSLLVSLGPFPPVYFMPDLKGTDGSFVSKALVAMGFKVQISFQASPAREAGRIVDQNPPCGSPVAQGETILLVLGTEDEMLTSSWQR